VSAETTQARSQRDLEWPEVCAAIARHTLSDLGREKALSLGPVEDQETAETRLSVLFEVLKLLSEGAPLPAGMLRDCRAALETLRRHGVISAPELRELWRLMEVAIGLDRFGGQHEDSAPLLARVLALSPELPPLCRRLAEIIDEDGSILDSASPGLAAARAEVRTLRAQMKKRIEEVIGRYREALQDGYYAERDGRYVLPVRSDAPFRVDGIVLDTSQSGSTLYVEPKELAQLGNKIRLAEADVIREEALVLAEISAELAPHAEELLWAQDMAVRADLLRAIGEFAREVDARVVPFDAPGALHLKEARHPLLCLQDIDVVPNDLTITPECGLVLSGPNAGGKTVALKTLGLLALLQASGLPVPAHEETRIGFFQEVLCDIGDDQSLSMSLSSFSGHVERVKKILDESGHGTLVLFDELMSGTDPDEGAVLAIATVDALVASGSAVCVTTHYEPLKEHAAKSTHLQNGAVGFDFEKMGPTFRVEMGRPGASSAIIVAERHGLPRFITERAVKLMPEVAAQKRERTLALEEQSLALENERTLLKAALAEQESLNRRSSLELDRLREKRRTLLSEESDALRAEVRQAREELRKVRKAFKEADTTSLRQLDDAISTASMKVAMGSAVDREVRSEPKMSSGLDESTLRVGMKVGIRGFDSGGEILELPKKGAVRVLIGVMKMSVPVKDLIPPQGAKHKPAPTPRRTTSFEQAHVELPCPIRSQDVILDLRGERVEAALTNLDQFLDDLLRRQEVGGFILHGHGTGAMKEAVRSHLSGHPCIQRSRPAERDEGGDAFTVFWLSGA
jgi:DNA mismatch repair protein MutS2